MRKISLICLFCSMCIISPARAAQGPTAVEMTMVPAVVAAGAGFIGNFIMAIMTAIAFHKPTTPVEAAKYDKAAALDGGSVVANFGAGIAAGVSLSVTPYYSQDFFKAARITIPVGIALSAGASVMSGFAGQSMDSVVPSNDFQRNEANSIAIANYVFAGVEAIACILFVTGAAFALRHW